MTKESRKDEYMPFIKAIEDYARTVSNLIQSDNIIDNNALDIASKLYFINNVSGSLLKVISNTHRMDVNDILDMQCGFLADMMDRFGD